MQFCIFVAPYFAIIDHKCTTFMVQQSIFCRHYNMGYRLCRQPMKDSLFMIDVSRHYILIELFLPAIYPSMAFAAAFPDPIAIMTVAAPVTVSPPA